jgi:hypothetical protein
MMFFNHRPKNVVDLNVIVEDMDKRFTEDEQADILSIVRDVLGGDEEGAAEEGEQADTGDDTEQKG